jgi:hypothetical protein
LVIGGGETRAHDTLHRHDSHHHRKEFDEIDTDGDATIPPEDRSIASRLGFMLRNKKGRTKDKILCARIDPHEDEDDDDDDFDSTHDMWLAKDA